jgi:hypothetical protein
MTDVKRLDDQSVRLFIFSPIKIPTLFLFPVCLQNVQICPRISRISRIFIRRCRRQFFFFENSIKFSQIYFQSFQRAENDNATRTKRRKALKILKLRTI